MNFEYFLGEVFRPNAFPFADIFCIGALFGYMICGFRHEIFKRSEVPAKPRNETTSDILWKIGKCERIMREENDDARRQRRLERVKFEMISLSHDRFSRFVRGRFNKELDSVIDMAAARDAEKFEKSKNRIVGFLR